LINLVTVYAITEFLPNDSSRVFIMEKDTSSNEAGVFSSRQ
jgi:hypothetical protein